MTSDTTENHAIGGKLGQVAGRSDKGKAILHTIDPDFILGIGRISEFGARKYHMRNFLMAPGMEWSRVYESLLRHLFLWWGGEENDVGPNGEFGETDDPETSMKWSGMPHLLHVAWNVMVLYTYSHRSVYQPGDDRPGVIEYDDGDWKQWRGEFDTAREIAVEDMPVPPQASAGAAMAFEDRLVSLLHELEELGFKAGNYQLVNDKGERIEDVISQYKVPKPSFIKDPLRRGMVERNKEGEK